MVKNAELWVLERKIKAFVGITDETLGDPLFVDLLTQISDLRLNTKKVQGEIGVYWKNVDGHIAWILNFRDATTQRLEGLHKEKENFAQRSLYSVGMRKSWVQVVENRLR